MVFLFECVGSISTEKVQQDAQKSSILRLNMLGRRAHTEAISLKQKGSEYREASLVDPDLS